MNKVHILYASSIIMAAIIIGATILIGTGTINTERFFEKHYTIKKVVAQDLINPDSAKFRGIKNVSLDDDPEFCGEVNGKNKFGSYAGWKRFHIWKVSGDWSVTIGEIAQTMCD